MVSLLVSSVFHLCYCLVIGTSEIDCLEMFVSKMTGGYVSSRTLSTTHLLSHIQISEGNSNDRD